MGFGTHRKAEVVDQHLADLALLLELVLRVQVVVPIRTNAVDLIAGERISLPENKDSQPENKVPDGWIKRKKMSFFNQNKGPDGWIKSEIVEW